MTPAEKERLRLGRERAAAERRDDQIERVDRYRAWCRTGGSTPEIPTAADFRVHRQARGVRR